MSAQKMDDRMSAQKLEDRRRSPKSGPKSGPHCPEGPVQQDETGAKGPVSHD